MITKVKIRIADWRDWKEIQALRTMTPRPLEGGLYELLHWPTFHVHYAMPEDSQEIIGFTSVALLDGDVVEDAGTAVKPEWRRQGIASQLRLTQIRDLMEMGFHSLFTPTHTEEGADWARTHLTEIGTAGTFPYFGGATTDVFTHLLDRGVLVPHPLSPDNRARLAYKAGRARQDLARLTAWSDLLIQRLALRFNYGRES